MPNPNSEFLAPGARLGTWWVPADDDLNDEGGIGELPQRRDPGVLVPSTNGGWGLSLARQLHAGVSGFESLRTGRGKCDLMWGDVPGSAISLFDAIRTSHSTDYSHSYSVWHGEWYVDSPTTWVDASRKVRPVNVAFAALAAWSERQPGLGLEIDLQGQWDETRTTFTRPEPAVYLAVVGDATVRLRRELVGTISSDKLDLWLSTWFSVEDDVELGDVRHKWVVPLHDFVSFFWLRNPGVAWIRVQLAESKVLWPAEVHYAGRLARVDEEHQVQTSEQLAQFATLQGILAHGYSFQDLICGYWQWRERGYGRALELLNESQDPQLDQSLDAQLLNAVKSLESYVRTQTGTNKVNLGKELKQLLDGAGRIGTDIRDIWRARESGQQHFENSIARLRGDYVAHGQGGTTDTSRSRNKFLDQYWHLVALQWLLRRTYLQEMGIDAEAASKLVTDTLGYKRDRRTMRDHYRNSATPTQ